MNGIHEADLLDRSLIHLQEIFGEEVLIASSVGIGKKGAGADEVITIQNHPLQLDIELHPEVSRIKQVVSARNGDFQDRLFVFDNTSKAVSDYCRTHQMNFIDSDGNCFLNLADIKVYVEKKFSAKSNRKSSRAFQKMGLKLLYCFFTQPRLLSASYRNIAAQTHISLASISAIMEDLDSKGFLLSVDKNRKKLANGRQLVAKWAHNYLENLKPSLHRGFFVAKDPNRLLATIREFPDPQLFVSGELGAEMAGVPIKPKALTLYTNKRLSELAKTYHLFPTEDPQAYSIEVLEPVWLESLEEEAVPGAGQLVPAELLYADLIDSNDFRVLEIANQVLLHEIQPKFESNHFPW